MSDEEILEEYKKRLMRQAYLDFLDGGIKAASARGAQLGL